MSKIFRKLTSVLFFLYPLYLLGHNHQVDYVLFSKKYQGTACWRSYNGKIAFSGDIPKMKNKSFSFISRDNMFIVETDSCADTMYVTNGKSDLLKVLETGRRFIDKGIKNQKSIYKIVTVNGEREIEMKIINRRIEIISYKHGLPGNFGKKITAYTTPSTGGTIMTGWDIKGVTFKYAGYTLLNENGEPK